MKKKISLLLIALCGFQIIFNNHKEQAFATQAQHLTQELIVAQEKKNKLDNNPKTTTKDKYTDYSSLSDKIHSSGKGEAAIQNPLMAAIRLYSDQPGVIAKTEKDYREISSSTYNALLKEYEDARREATWVVNDFEQHRGSPTLTLDELLHIVISGNKYPLIKWSMGLTDLIPNE